ncbi:MAG TPA: methyltransferase domain-containing protein [Casimicrobiaceae bacterium]|jgi:SAM-dependent methyltransferase
MRWHTIGIDNCTSRDKPAQIRVEFRCNLCGAHCNVPASAISRESRSCVDCGSTVRLRSIIHLLTTELFGRSIPLPELPLRKDIVGIGLSDAVCYAAALAQNLSYTNTFFDIEPRLDIANVDENLSGIYDFIIASDVFEHIAPPVSRAFNNARRLLKPQGFMVFTVPYTLETDTIEHFPQLNDYRIVKTDAGFQLENRTLDGEIQVFADPIFHDGSGVTLEMRLFSRLALEREFAGAGFSRLRFADEGSPAYGIGSQKPWEIPMVAHA